MAWSVDAEINWAVFYSCRSHPRKRRDRSLHVQEACDLQSNRVGYLNTPLPQCGCLSQSSEPPLCCLACPPRGGC